MKNKTIIILIVAAILIIGVIGAIVVLPNLKTNNGNASLVDTTETDNYTDTDDTAVDVTDNSTESQSTPTNNGNSSSNPSSNNSSSSNSELNSWKVGTKIKSTCYWSAGTAPQQTSSSAQIMMHCADQPSTYMFSQMVIYDTSFDIQEAMSGRKYTVSGTIQDIAASAAGYSLPIVIVDSIK